MFTKFKCIKCITDLGCSTTGEIKLILLTVEMIDKIARNLKFEKLIGKEISRLAARRRFN